MEDTKLIASHTNCIVCILIVVNLQPDETEKIDGEVHEQKYNTLTIFKETVTTERISRIRLIFGSSDFRIFIREDFWTSSASALLSAFLGDFDIMLYLTKSSLV